MADTAAATEKTKEKKKKKSSGSVKEKDSKKKSIDAGGPTESAPEQSNNETAAPSDNTEAAAREAAGTAPGAPTDLPAEQPIAETSDPAGTPKKSRSKSKSEVKEALNPDETTGETNAGSRKSSTTDAANRKASTTGASRKASTAESRDTPLQEGAENKESKNGAPKEEEIGVLPDPDDMPQIKHTYVVPPAATKRDIDLLVDMDETKLMELKEAFGLFDYDQDGYIDFKDLKLTYQTLGQPDVPDEDILNMLAEAVNPLDFDAFVILLGYKTIEMDPEAILVEALSCWDYDNSGMISEERIKHDLMTWGDKFTKEEVEMALEDAPVYITKKGISMIDYIKFCNTLSGLRKKTREDMPEQPEEP